MSDQEKYAKNIERFRQSVASHDRMNPTHTSNGIGVAYHDLERLGFEDGEELWPGITIQVDGKATGNFRVLCDGTHDEASGKRLKEETETEEIEAVDAVSTVEA